MQTKPRADDFEVPLDRGALAPTSGVTASPVAGRNVRPAQQSLTDMGQIYFSARRFLALPEIGELFSWGSNGLSCRMPQSDHARLNLYRRLPQPEACARLEEMLSDQIAEGATPSGIRQAVAALIAAFPTGSRADVAYVATMIDLLVEEAELARWNHLSLIGGFIRIARTSTFLPSFPEVAEAIAEARQEIWSAYVFAQKAQDIFQELEDRLILAGLLRFEIDEDDGWGDIL